MVKSSGDGAGAKKARSRPLDGAGDRLADARMAVSRHAVTLFLARGVSATSGDDIAAAAGVSTRTVWRYFRSKESCVEPMLAASAYRFIAPLRRWPLHATFEDFLLEDFAEVPPTPQDLADDALSMGLISLVRDEPALRASWLMVCGQAEQAFVPVVARRLDLPVDEFRVSLSAATAMAAARVVHEEVAVTAVTGVRTYTVEDVVRLLGKAIRASTAEPICDPRPRRAFLA
ncbi:TetR family transcriptional regulator [Virgisporangium aliadipatigenens]|uniref:TetR family transcriptional regulator n=1 Tax=Virgisporangium aliadipatigenens TaxID=741659 RepID=A0A8J4DRD1_9ACTN|nr:TetR/AcrR family transcriptional regulator [Virgisporangium aliadipatigenens]GIJ46197.1 TetR family transcriptional regulator [Virgisporangium aliadipatigenens]